MKKVVSGVWRRWWVVYGEFKTRCRCRCRCLTSIKSTWFCCVLAISWYGELYLLPPPKFTNLFAFFIVSLVYCWILLFYWIACLYVSVVRLSVQHVVVLLNVLGLFCGWFSIAWSPQCGLHSVCVCLWSHCVFRRTLKKSVLLMKVLDRVCFWCMSLMNLIFCQMNHDNRMWQQLTSFVHLAFWDVMFVSSKVMFVSVRWWWVRGAIEVLMNVNCWWVWSVGECEVLMSVECWWGVD